MLLENLIFTLKQKKTDSKSPFRAGPIARKSWRKMPLKLVIQVESFNPSNWVFPKIIEESLKLLPTTPFWLLMGPNDIKY